MDEFNAAYDEGAMLMLTCLTHTSSAIAPG